MSAKYKCRSCKKLFTRPKPGPTDCKFCGHRYVKWLNILQFRPDLKGAY